MDQCDALNQILFALVGPFSTKFDRWKKHQKDIDGEQVREMTKADFCALTNFVEYSAKQPHKYSPIAYTQILTAFWFVCDTVVGLPLLCSDFGRHAIITAIGICNNVSVSKKFQLDQGYKTPSDLLSGLFGCMYEFVLSKSGYMAVPNHEKSLFKSLMTYNACDCYVPWHSPLLTSPHLHSCLQWRSLSVANKVNVAIRPSSQMVHLFLKHGASARIANLDIGNSLDALYKNFYFQVQDGHQPDMPQEDREDVERCARLLFNAGARSVVPFHKIIQDIQTMGIDDMVAMDYGSSDSNYSSAESGNLSTDSSNESD